ncbi:MAG: acetolactate synthase large subunit, partial [Lachnospiraceae bacterium]|nr:acetolactate synthase large subunit [Lachnospiraceae bacterium]
IGDVKDVLNVMLSRLTPQNHQAWLKKIFDLKESYPLTYDQEGLTGPFIMEKIYELTKGEAIISTDVGQHQMWAAQFIKYKHPRTFLTSGGLGTMGYGLGACIGAKVGVPDRHVINIAGDGCFRMNIQELATASRYNIPIIEVCINNHVLGMVRQWQNLFYGQRYSHTILQDKVDFVKVSEGFGVKAVRITKKEELEPALKEALAYDGPVVLDCWIDQDDKVFPMVSPGGNIADAFSEEDLKNR